MQTTPPGRDYIPGMVLKADDLQQGRKNTGTTVMRSGPGTLVSRSSQGQTIRVKRASSAATSFIPRFCVRRAAPGKVKFGVGIFRGAGNDGGVDIYPIVGIGGSSILVKPAPQLSITGNGGIYVTAIVTNDGKVTSAVITFSAEAPQVVSGAWSTIIANITDWTNSTFKIQQVIQWNVQFQICDDSPLWHASA